MFCINMLACVISYVGQKKSRDFMDAWKHIAWAGWGWTDKEQKQDNPQATNRIHLFNQRCQTMLEIESCSP